MEKEQTLILTGATQNPYTFTVYPWNTPLINFGGVYAVLRYSKTGYSIIYIGRTGELKSHLLCHPLKNAFDQAGKTHIGVHIESVIVDRYKKQMDLIVNFSPSLNMK